MGKVEAKMRKNVAKLSNVEQKMRKVGAIIEKS